MCRNGAWGGHFRRSKRKTVLVQNITWPSSNGNKQQQQQAKLNSLTGWSQIRSPCWCLIILDPINFKCATTCQLSDWALFESIRTQEVAKWWKYYSYPTGHWLVMTSRAIFGRHLETDAKPLFLLMVSCQSAFPTQNHNHNSQTSPLFTERLYSRDCRSTWPCQYFSSEKHKDGCWKRVRAIS